jgi:serine/threonine-protein kinase
MSFDAQTPWTVGPPPPAPKRRTGPMVAAIAAAVAVVVALVVVTVVFLRRDADEAADATPPTSATTGSSATLLPSAATPVASVPPATVEAATVPAAPVQPATVTVTAPPPVTVTAPPPVIVTAPAPVTIVQQAPAPVYRAAYGDLGLSVPMTRPACDGLGIVLLFSSVSPGAYAAEIQQALNTYPGASYLRTDQACSSLTQSSDSGNPVYAVYSPAGYSTGSVCAAVNSYGGSAYGKWLDNSSAADATIDC